MADVMERGQLIIVTGLLLAVSFVLLALLLNTVIFTENLASRGTDFGGRDAIEFQRTVDTGVGELVDEENELEHGSQSAVESNVSDGIEEMDDLLTRRHAERAIVADIDTTSITLHEGKLVRQPNASREFLDSSETTNWVMVENATEVRQFTMTVDRDDLAVANESNASSVAFTLLADETEGSDTWRAFVYENETSGHLSIATQRNAGSVTQVCSSDQGTVTIDLTAGTIAGAACDGFEWAESVDDMYDLEYVRGDQAAGTYNLTVDTTDSLTEVNSATVNDGTVDDSAPYHVPAVYSVTLSAHYETADVSYSVTLRIAQGEAA